MERGKLIINADDFGISNSVNEAIIQSFNQGLISSTTILTNMPGFLNAANLYSRENILKDRVGLHINLTEGVALTDRIKKERTFCDISGNFIYSRSKKKLFYLTAGASVAAYLEIKAQVAKAKSFGIIPSHIDSHHHIRTELAIFRVVLEVIKEEKIKKIRLARNMGIENSIFKKIYKQIINYSIKANNFNSVDNFGDVDDFNIWKNRKKMRAVEVMVHPMYTTAGELIDADQKLLSEKVRFLRNNYEMISYFELNK